MDRVGISFLVPLVFYLLAKNNQNTQKHFCILSLSKKYPKYSKILLYFISEQEIPKILKKHFCILSPIKKYTKYSKILLYFISEQKIPKILKNTFVFYLLAKNNQNTQKHFCILSPSKK